MIPIKSAFEMQEFERKIFFESGITEEQIIENVGREVAFFLEERYGSLQRPFVFFYGPGNNGSDALCAARQLAQRGFSTFIYTPFPLQHERCWYRQALFYGVKSIDKWELLPKDFVAIDGLLGTKAHLPLSEKLVHLLKVIQEKASCVVALDIPTGILSDTGEGCDGPFMADVTLAIAFPKWGHFLRKGAYVSGEVVVLPGGFPCNSLKEEFPREGESYLVDSCTVTLPLRSSMSYKNLFGHLLLIGGNPGYMGALQMASMAALRTGVGLVSAHTLSSSYSEMVATFPPEIIKGRLQKKWDTYTALTVGPGFLPSEEKRELVLDILQETTIPLVLDAGAITVLSYERDAAFLRKRQGPTLLTPHVGEFASFLGIEKEDVLNYSPNDLKKLAASLNCVLILKSWQTFMVFPDKTLLVWRKPHSAKAKGGSGDILSGLLGGLLASLWPKYSVKEIALLAHKIHDEAIEKALSLGHRPSTLQWSDLWPHLGQLP